MSMIGSQVRIRCDATVASARAASDNSRDGQGPRRFVMTPTRLKIHRTAAAAILLACMGGCASVPPPNDALSAADMAINAAATPDARHYAADELDAARRELTAAQDAMTQHDYAHAQQLAAAALADADLARAKSRALAAQSAVAAKSEDNATLRHRLLDQEPLR